MTEKNFFSEEASRQILQRLANVCNDPDLCDVTFEVGDGTEREEILTPSQFMAAASPYFKEMFYPPSGNRKQIPTCEPQVFRKVLDYLFRGRVPLSSIEDAWKVKLAAKRFQLTDLEDLCSKFLKYRLDASNLITFLRNSTKYDAPDIKEVVISRFTKDANNVMTNDQVLDLTQEEMVSLLETEPDLHARKLMAVLIKWSRKRYGLDLEQSVPSEKKPRLEYDENGQLVPPVEGDEAKKEAAAGEESDTPNLIKPQKPFLKYVKWARGDGEFFVGNVKGKKIMSTEDENDAMAQMISSFIEGEPLKSPPKVTITPVRAGPKSRKRN